MNTVEQTKLKSKIEKLDKIHQIKNLRNYNKKSILNIAKIGTVFF